MADARQPRQRQLRAGRGSHAVIQGAARRVRRCEHEPLRWIAWIMAGQGLHLAGGRSGSRSQLGRSRQYPPVRANDTVGNAGHRELKRSGDMTRAIAVRYRGRRPVLDATVDGSVSAQGALSWAAAEASYRHCPLHIVHAVNWPTIGNPLNMSMVGPMTDGLRAAAEWVLGDAENHARRAAPGIGVTAELFGADVAESGTTRRTGGRRQPGHRRLPRSARRVGECHPGRARPMPGDRGASAPGGGGIPCLSTGPDRGRRQRVGGLARSDPVRVSGGRTPQCRSHRCTRRDAAAAASVTRHVRSGCRTARTTTVR